MLRRRFRCHYFLIAAVLLALHLGGGSEVYGAPSCPPSTPEEVEIELAGAINNLTTPTPIKCVASPARKHYPDNGWDIFIDPTFISWNGNNGSLNLAVVTAAVGLYRFPNSVMRKSPDEQPMTWLNWWVLYMSAQTGEAVPAGYPPIPANRPHLYYYKGTEQFSNIYDAPVVTSIVAVRYWAYLNGHSLLIRLTEKYLRANWAIYATAAGKGPVWTYDLARQLFPDGTTAPIRTALCHPPKPHPDGTEFDRCAPQRSSGGYQYNGRFLALAGARSKLAGHWNSDGKFPLFDRAIESVPSPLQSYETNTQQRVILDALEQKWPSLQWSAPQPPPTNENLYGLSRTTDIPQINTVIMSTDSNASRSAVSYLMSLMTFVRTSTTHRIIAWPGWRVSVMESNTNGNSPNMYGVAYRESDPNDPSHAIATFMHPWTNGKSGGADGWARLEAPPAGGDGLARIHASNRKSNPTATDPQPRTQPIKEVVMSVPGSPPLYHLVLSPGNAPYLDNTPPGGWPPTPKLSPPPSFAPQDNTTAWVFSEVPAGAITGGTAEDWNWIDANPAPQSEAAFVHQSNNVAEIHQHFFYYATDTLTVNSGDKLYAWVYLDPANPPTEVMLQWFEAATGWEHRAYWGANNIGWGADGSGSRRYMGPLPPPDQWALLEVPASMVGVEGRTLSGMAFTLFNGQATWDEAGKISRGGPVTNLAVGKVATQSSTAASAPPARAVDGNRNGNFYSNSVTHTDYNNQAWWQVDLGSSYQLDQVNIWNRTDCCPERLSSFYVLVSDNPFTSTDLTTTLNQGGVSSYYIAGSAGSPSMVAILRSGRYVRIQLSGTNYLSLAEVEVLGQASSSPPPPPPPPTATVSVAWVKPAEASWGTPNTLTAAGYAQNGAGGVQLFWRDETTGSGWNTADFQPAPAADNSWSNTIPSPYKCHTFRVYATYAGVRSQDFVYTGATAGYCTETARVTWIQPQSTAGFGNPGTLVVGGSASNAPSGTLVFMRYRDLTAGTPWVQAPYAPPPNGNGDWINEITGPDANTPANPLHRYEVQITYDVKTAGCTYQGNNAISWCP